MIFRLYAVYIKHEMIKFGKQTREKSQVLSQVLKNFVADSTLLVTCIQEHI